VLRLVVSALLDAGANVHCLQSQLDHVSVSAPPPALRLQQRRALTLCLPTARQIFWDVIIVKKRWTIMETMINCSYRLKLSAQRNETETKQFQNSFESVLFQFHFAVRTV